VTEAGQKIIGRQSGRVHRTSELGFMNRNYSFIDRTSAITLNFLARRRAVSGNYNAPENFAAYLNDFPARNRITIRDANGVAIAGADVFFYRAEATVPTERWYGARFDDTPDLVLRTDANGQVLVGRSPFSADGTVTHAPDLNNGVVIVKVKKGAFVAHGFLESRSFNLEFWRGHTELADHDLVVGLTCPFEGPRIDSPEWDQVTTGATTLSWSAMAGAERYRVSIVGKGKPPRVITTTDPSVVLRLNGQVDWWVEADFGLCGTRRSEAARYHGSNVPVSRRRGVRH
jgi:hypothetical protein